MAALPHDEENHKEGPILTKQALKFCCSILLESDMLSVIGIA